MTKRINWQANERVDIPDMDAGTNLLSSGLVNQLVYRATLDHFARVGFGFRVQIANQTTAPGEFTVFNGAAWDRSGQILNNEDEENTSRSFTLLANGVYYVEAVFITSDSDTDARGFWDPSFDNGTDPSGDERLPGREFSENVATRLSPDWQIVSPVSTSGFNILSNPNSLRIPIAVLTVTGGAITGASTSPPVTVLENSIAAGVTSIKCFNTLEFPDAFNANLGTESVSITANDRVNGVLSLAGGLSNPHSTGERLIQTGSAQQFLVDRISGTVPTTGTQDARPRMFQGNPNRGFGLLQSPYNAGRSDTQLQTLKDKIDELSGTIREMKWGAVRDSDIGKLAPPAAFSASPREYDQAFGTAGAKTNTISIGDGVNSWGDFNALQEGSFDAALSAALTALGSGSIYIKKGDYSSSAAHTMPTGRYIRIFGDADGATSITATVDSQAIFQCPNGTLLNLQDLVLDNSAGTTPIASITLTNANSVATISMTRVQCVGIVCADTSAINSGTFNDCVFTTRGTQIYALKGDIEGCVFNRCEFTATGTPSAGARALLIGGATSFSAGTDTARFNDCAFEVSTTATVAAVEFKGTHAHANVKFDHCEFDGGISTATAVIIPSATTTAVFGLRMVDCVSNFTNGLLQSDNSTNVVLEGCSVPLLGEAGAFGVHLSAIGTGCSNIRIRDCSFTQAATSTTTGSAAIQVDTANGLIVDNCDFNNVDYGIAITSLFDGTVNGCRHNCDFGFGRVFARTVSGGGGEISNSLFVGNRIDGLTCVLEGAPAGFLFAQSDVFGVSVVNNTISSIGTTATTSSPVAIGFASGGAGNIRDTEISGNIISNLVTAVTSSAIGIGVIASTGATSLRTKIHNNSIVGVGTSSLNGSGITVSGVTQCSIANNMINNIGNTSHGDFSGINCSIAIATTITNNSITNVGGQGATTNNAGIAVHTSGSRILVDGNTIDMQNAAATAYITVAQLSSDANTLHTVTVSHNECNTNLGAGCSTGIYVNANSGAGSNGFKITDNSIYGLPASGIGIIATDIIGTVVLNIDVTGNDIQSSSTTPIGIFLDFASQYHVTDNKVIFTNTAADAKRGIYLVGTIQGVIGHNVICMSGAGGSQPFIEAAGGGGLLFSSNWIEAPGVGSAVGIGILASGSASNMFADGNVTFNITTPYSGSALSTTGTAGQNWHI